jgi:S-adenosylmethionine:tRNA-ribosyltransferase-isomerase (queuine synthetase)
MSMDTWQRNTSGMIAHAQRRKEQTLQRVDAAITKLLRDNAAVNFNTVSKEAAVTKQYLYANEQVRGRIEALRGQHRERALRERLARPPGKTDAGKDVVLLAKDRRIAELEDDVRRLKKELQGALGKLYERA